mmetsp:Transcript_19988/g.49887  ORF Transcript_19988/g.49887 Transcript_19988/m.49887 type:complete len:244 (+) Transcript_19988:72-803(+)
MVLTSDLKALQRLWFQALTSVDAKTLQRLWFQAVVFQDTLVGRDKSIRFFQYVARLLSGITNMQVFANLLSALALSRKTLRFGRQLKLAKNIRECYLGEQDSMNRITTILEDGSFIIYCFMDHVCFTERIKLLKLSPRRSEMLDRFTEVFWITEAAPALLREIRAYVSGGGADVGSAQWQERRDRAKLLILKLSCDLACAFYCVQRSSWRNRRQHKVWCGVLGAIASAVSIKMNWPRECIEVA